MKTFDDTLVPEIPRFACKDFFCVSINMTVDVFCDAG